MMVQDSSKLLNWQKQIRTRNELKLNQERMCLKKTDTRGKIQLGGLIVKAGLEEQSSSILLGLLCDAFLGPTVNFIDNGLSFLYSDINTYLIYNDGRPTLFPDRESAIQDRMKIGNISYQAR